MKTFDKAGNLIPPPAELVVNDLTQAPTFEGMPDGEDVYVVVTVKTTSGKIRLVLMDPSVLAKADKVEAIEEAMKGKAKAVDMAQLTALMEQIEARQQEMPSAATMAELTTILQQTQHTAEQAKVVATAAENKADTASLKASSAESKAEAADSKAGVADSKAVTAQSAAGTANTTATAAKDSLSSIESMVVKRSKLIEFPQQTLSYTAVLALGAGAMKLTKTGITGVKTTDVLIARSAAPMPDGYMLGDAMCSVDGTVDFRIVRPALVLGANFSIVVRLFGLRIDNT